MGMCKWWLHTCGVGFRHRQGGRGNQRPSDSESEAGTPRVAKHLADDARALPDVLVHDGAGHHLEEVGLDVGRDGPRQQCLPRAGGPVQQHALGGGGRGLLARARAITSLTCFEKGGAEWMKVRACGVWRNGSDAMGCLDKGRDMSLPSLPSPLHPRLAV